MNELKLQESILRAGPRLMLGMLYKLSVHAVKGPWDEVTLERLVQGLESEVSELLVALRQGEPYECVLDECADIANYAMMIADHVATVGNEWQPPRICAGGVEPSDTWRPPMKPGPITRIEESTRCGYISATMHRCTLPLNHGDGHAFSA